MLRYKLDSRDCYQKGTPQSSLSELLESKKETQDSQHPEERFPSVNSHDKPPTPQTTVVNDSNTQEVLERNPHTQIMTTEMSDRSENYPLDKHGWHLLGQGDPSSKV